MLTSSQDIFPFLSEMLNILLVPPDIPLSWGPVLLSVRVSTGNIKDNILTSSPRYCRLELFLPHLDSDLYYSQACSNCRSFLDVSSLEH